MIPEVRFCGASPRGPRIQVLGSLLRLREPMITTDVVAHHEAGHAVVAVILDLPLGYASVKPDPDKYMLGVTMSGHRFSMCAADDGSWEDLLDELAWDRFEQRQIVCALAGRLAEQYVGAAAVQKH